MRMRTVATTVLTAAGLLAAGQTTASATTTHYYVSLGDSLSQGYQLGHDTDQGYADDLYATLKAKDPSLQLVKLGCPGETTTTMVNGGICTYPQGSQLGAAKAFLAAHRRQVRFLTLDIGANDVDGCLTGGAISPNCIVTGLGTITANLTRITATLRVSGSPKTTYLAMNYYDPFLAVWLKGASSHSLAAESVILGDTINTVEQRIYGAVGFKVADVAKTFATNDFGHPADLPGAGSVPQNVYRICTWTWMCLKGDIHANAAGYQQIATTFATLIPR